MFSNYLYAFKNKMAKKHSKTEAKTGMIYRCGNCDAECDGLLSVSGFKMEQGRQSIKHTTHFCDRMCANKFSRDELRGDFIKDIESMTPMVDALSKYLAVIMRLDGDKKTCFEAIRMTKQHIKVKKLMIAGTQPQHIVAVELFKLGETAMKFAELIAEEEDKIFITMVNSRGGGDYTQIEAYNLAMWARDYSNNKQECLGIWFN